MKRILVCFALWMMVLAAAVADGPSIPMVVTLEGTEYTMPCSVSELMDDGWTLYNYEQWEYLAIFEKDENDELYDQFYIEDESFDAWRDWFDEGYREAEEIFRDRQYKYTRGIKDRETQEFIEDELSDSFFGSWYNSKVEECQSALAIDLERVLAPGEAYGLCMMAQEDGKEVIVFVENLGDEDCEVKDCAVTMLAIETRDTIIRNPARLIYEGVEVGVTSKDNVPAWTLEYRGNIGELYVDKFDYSSGLEYALNAGAFDPTYDEEMKELIVSVGRYKPLRSATLDREYTAPQKMEEDWTSGTIMVDGKLYQMPVPIEEILKEGWIADTELVYTYESKSYSGYMTKGSKEIGAEVFFEADGDGYYDDECTRWIYGDIVSLSFNLNDGVDVQAGLFYLGMPEKEMLEACRTLYGMAPEAEESKYADGHWYMMYAGENGVQLTCPEGKNWMNADSLEIGTDNGIVDQINIQFFPGDNGITYAEETKAYYTEELLSDVSEEAEEVELPLEVIIGDGWDEERYTLPCRLGEMMENSWRLHNENYHMLKEFFYDYNHIYDEDHNDHGLSFEQYLEMCETEEKYSDEYIQVLRDTYHDSKYEKKLEEFNEFYFEYELEEWDDTFYEQLLEGFEAYYADELGDAVSDCYWLDEEHEIKSAAELSDDENIYILRRFGDEETMVVTLRSEDGKDCPLGDFLVTSISVGNTDTIFEPYQDKWAKVACAGLKYGETTWQDIPDNIDADAGFAWFEGEEEVTGRPYAISASFLGEGETLDQMTISVQ